MEVTGDLEKSSVMEQWEWRPDHMGSCGRDGKRWTDSIGRVPDTIYLLTIGPNNLLRKQVQGLPKALQRS